MAVHYGVTEKKEHLFMMKIKESTSSSCNHPMVSEVHLDEFVLGGKYPGKIGRSYSRKKKKAVTAIELTEEGKVKRLFAMLIKDFSAESLQYIFVNPINREACVTRDKWHG